MARLDEIADVLVGATPGRDGDDVRYVRLPDIDEAGISQSWGALAPAPVKGLDSLLRDGDVLVRSKGRAVAAGRVRSEHVGCYATADVYVIRPRTAALNSDYLVAVIRSPAAHQQLTASFQGTSVARLAREGLAALEIPLPPVATQAAIGHLAADAETEIKIIDELRGLRAQLHTELLQRALEKARAEDGNPRHGLTRGPADASAKGQLPTLKSRKSL